MNLLLLLYYYNFFNNGDEETAIYLHWSHLVICHMLPLPDPCNCLLRLCKFGLYCSGTITLTLLISIITIITACL